MTTNLKPKTRQLRTDGRRKNADGYIHVPLPEDHPFAEMRRKDGRVLEHRLIAAVFLGRPLRPYPDEIVNHENGVRSDNRPENLLVISGNDSRTGDQRHGEYHYLRDQLEKDWNLDAEKHQAVALHEHFGLDRIGALPVETAKRLEALYAQRRST